MHVILVAYSCLTPKIDELLAVVVFTLVVFPSAHCGAIQRRKYSFKLREGKGRKSIDGDDIGGRRLD